MVTMAQDFTNLNVWARAHELTLEIYKITSKFPSNELYGLTQQLRRAVISIELNIAEGTSGGRNLFSKYLITSIGSCKETECCLMISRDLNYLKDNEYTEVVGKTKKIQGMLVNLLKSVKSEQH